MIVNLVLVFLIFAGLCAWLAGLAWLANSINDWMTRKREPAHATSELRTVTQAWVRCATCRRRVPKGERAIFYRPSLVSRCADCAKAKPEIATIREPQPGECPSCHSAARELPAVITMNGRELTVCRTCAEFAKSSATTRPATKQTLF